MTPALLVDGLILLALVAAIVTGWRQGAFASVLATIGVVAGLILGAALAPPVMQLTESVALRFLLGLGTIIMLVGLGNLIGGVLGSSLRDRMRMRASQTIDSAVGALFTAAATLLVIWLISIPLATGLTGSVSQGIRNSTILGFVDRNTPPGLEQLPARITVLLDESGLPPIFAPFDEPPARDVAAPNIQIDDHALVERVRPSVVHIQGDSDQCFRRLMGSGFVTEPDYVITNAHVVAGTQSVRLDTVLGVKEAEVVYYNPGVDIAVLHSPGADPGDLLQGLLHRGDVGGVEVPLQLEGVGDLGAVVVDLQRPGVDVDADRPGSRPGLLQCGGHLISAGVHAPQVSRRGCSSAACSRWNPGGTRGRPPHRAGHRWRPSPGRRPGWRRRRC